MEPSVATRLDELTPRPSVPYPTIDPVPPVTQPPSESGHEPHIHQRPASPPPRRKHPFQRFLVSSFFVLLIPVAVSWALVFSMNYWTPPRSTFMKIDVETMHPSERLTYQYVSMDHISRYMVAAAIAHEDQQLGPRSGPFEWQDFQRRIIAHMKDEPDTSGSTIPQQLAKNLFLWPEQTGFRKGLEAAFSYELSYTMPRKRILELYLNYAQFGSNLYGICAASWYYFEQPPWNISETQAAMLATMLPHPEVIYKRTDGTIQFGSTGSNGRPMYVQDQEKVSWVGEQIANHGGWEKMMTAVGIYDSASSHEDTRSHPDACSTMPQTVMDRFYKEGMPTTP